MITNVPTAKKTVIPSMPELPSMPDFQREAQPSDRAINVPTPQEAIAPTPEAVQENEVLPSNPPKKFVGGLLDPFNYVNDLDEGGKRELIKPLITKLREILNQDTLSANDVAKCLDVSHTRITRNFPNGTKLSFILENLPKPRSIDPDKLVGRLSESAKRELLAKLQQELC